MLESTLVEWLVLLDLVFERLNLMLQYFLPSDVLGKHFVEDYFKLTKVF